MTTPQQSPFTFKGAARLSADDGTPLPIARPSNPEFMDAALGYLKNNYMIHFPPRTGLRSTTTRATLESFPDLSLVAEDRVTAIFESYTLAELKTIRKKVSSLLSKMDLSELQVHH